MPSTSVAFSVGRPVDSAALTVSASSPPDRPAITARPPAPAAMAAAPTPAAAAPTPASVATYSAAAADSASVPSASTVTSAAGMEITCPFASDNCALPSAFSEAPVTPSIEDIATGPAACASAPPAAPSSGRNSSAPAPSRCSPRWRLASQSRRKARLRAARSPAASAARSAARAGVTGVA